MNSTEIKELMCQFDQSSLREFSYTKGGEQLYLSKNQQSGNSTPVVAAAPASVATEQPAIAAQAPASSESEQTPQTQAPSQAEGQVVESPLVGVAYLAPAPDKAPFVSLGDTVKKGQTLLIIEAMKVMNEVPADRDGIVTEILVDNQDVVEFGQGLVRIK